MVLENFINLTGKDTAKLLFADFFEKSTIDDFDFDQFEDEPDKIFFVIFTAIHDYFLIFVENNDIENNVMFDFFVKNQTDFSEHQMNWYDDAGIWLFEINNFDTERDLIVNQIKEKFNF